MAENVSFAGAIEFYRKQFQRLCEELRTTLLLLNKLESDAGEQPTSPPKEIGLNFSDRFSMSDSVSTSVDGRSSEVRPDEFFGMSQSDAARAYLKKVNRAVSFDHLVQVLRKGGAEVGGADPKKTLYVSLMRNPKGEFVIPSDGHVGLRVFYPGLPKGGKTTKPKKGQRKSRKGKRAGPASGKGPSDIMVGLKQILTHGEPKTKGELVESLAEKLGHKIAPISVAGALRSKVFTEEGGRFSLAK